LRIHVPHLVVQGQPGVRLDRARATGQHHHRRTLGVGAGDRVDGIERARAVGHRDHAQPHVHARGGIRGEAQRRFVAERDQRQDPAGLHVPEERQDEITRDAEDLAGAVRLEGVQQLQGKVHGGSGTEGSAASDSNRARLSLTCVRTPAPCACVCLRQRCGEGTGVALNRR